MTQRVTEEKDPQTHTIIGAAIEVHRCLGSGFLESVYQQAMVVELAERGVPFRREVELPVTYKGRLLPCPYRADFLCHDEIIVELKAIASLGGIEQAQAINYLKATGLRRALLLNFGSSKLEVRRIRYDPHLCSSVKSVD
ncbi:MAG: GxxExxY protein [Phycisphaerales bacterium]|nr:GxxExxY protein [Phycisphaerales bacterium]